MPEQRGVVASALANADRKTARCHAGSASSQ